MPVVVSAYYKIPSKSTHEKYMEYMKLFFQFFKGKKVMFFTEQSVLDELHDKNIDTQGIEFILKKFNDLPILNKFPYSFWLRQKERDIETYHTPELGIIWSSKKEFVREASELLPEEQWFIWVDAGCVRKEEWLKFSNDFGTRNIPQNPGVYVGQLIPVPSKNFFMYPDTCLSGTISAFHKDYIKLFCEKYDDMLQTYDNAKVSATSDQYIVRSMMNKDDWIVPITLLRNTLQVPDVWFFLLAYF